MDDSGQFFVEYPREKLCHIVNYKFIENIIRCTRGVYRVFISIIRAIILSKHLLKCHYYDYHYYYHCYKNTNNIFQILSFPRHQN